VLLPVVGRMDPQRMHAAVMQEPAATLRAIGRVA
jgi:hypothetical protein